MKSSFPADTTDYRHQAKKFSHKLFALAEAAKQSSGSSHLIWLDCDVFCFTDVPEDFFSFLFHGLSGFYLGRSQYFSECGCWGMRTDAPFYPDFLFCFLDLYISGEVYQLDQQHDSWVFDWLRNNGDEQWKNAFYNLTPTVQSGHVWLASPLADYFDHWKGKRWRIKGTPKSWFDDLHKLRQQGVDITLSHPYWFPMPLRDGKLRHLYDAEFAKESETS